MENEAHAILAVFGQHGSTAGDFIPFTDFGDAIVWEAGFVKDEKTRMALRQLVEDGFVVELAAGLELTQKGNSWLRSNGALFPKGGTLSGYRTAQHAVADLKVAILQTLESGPTEGMSNAEIGRGLGIYMGHVGHEGHIPRTLLAVMESEGVVVQSVDTKLWRVRRPLKERAQ